MGRHVSVATLISLVSVLILASNLGTLALTSSLTGFVLPLPATAWISAAVLLVTIVVFLVGMRSVGRPLSLLALSADEIEREDFVGDVPFADRSDEIGRIARLIQARRAEIVRARNQATGEAERERERVAAGERDRAEARASGARETEELIFRSIGAGLEKLATADLSFRLDAALPAEYEKLRTDFNVAVAALD